VIHTCNPSTEAGTGDHDFEASLGYIMNPYLKKQKQKKSSKLWTIPSEGINSVQPVKHVYRCFGTIVNTFITKY
jgi:hypothetical protein